MSTLAERVATVNVTVGDAEITFESGKLAKQADGAVLATNTSTLDIEAIAGATSRPERVIGLALAD